MLLCYYMKFPGNVDVCTTLLRLYPHTDLTVTLRAYSETSWQSVRCETNCYHFLLHESNTLGTICASGDLTAS